MRPVFIGGAGRSGTTMFGAMIAPAVGGVAPPESHFVHELPLERMDAQAAARAIAGHWRFRIWEFEPGAPPIHVSDGPAYARWLVEAYAASQAIPRPAWWVDHTPENVLHWRTLFARFPDAKAIHLVRDGRGVMASIRPRPWGPTTVIGCARYWRERVEVGLAAEAEWGERILRVRYEDILTRTSETLDRVALFLGAERREEAAITGQFRKPSYTEGQHALVGRPPDPSRANAWRAQVSARDAEAFEALCGDLLHALDYTTDYAEPRPPGAAARVASAAQEAIAQGVVLPLKRAKQRGPFVARALRSKLGGR